MLTNSDWIAIIAASLQVAVAIGVAIWQVRRTQRPEPTRDHPKPRSAKFDWSWFLKQSWQFLFCSAAAVVLLWQSLATTQSISKSFVVEMVVYSFLLVFGLLCTVITAAITAARPSFLGLRQAMSNLDASREEGKRDI